MRLTTSQNALHFGIKCSKLRRLLGLRPRPRWGAYDAPSDPLVVRASCLRQSQLRAFGACTFPKFLKICPPPKLHTDFRLCYEACIISIPPYFRTTCSKNSRTNFRNDISPRKISLYPPKFLMT